MIARPATVFDLLEYQASIRPGAPALTGPDSGTVCYRALLELVQQTVALLRAGGVGSRSRVGIVMPNGPDLAVALMGVSCAAVAVPLNPSNRAAELLTYAHRTGLTHLLTQRGAGGAGRELARDGGLHLFEVETLLGQGGEARAVAPPMPDDIAVVLLTSGSTGQPKSVPLTHGNLCCSAVQVAESLRLEPRDVCLCMWEQYHIGGLVDLLLAPLCSGSHVICAGGFDAGRFFELEARFAPSWFQGVPTTLRDLLAFGRRLGLRPTGGSLRAVRSVAAALPPVLMGELEEYLGVPVIQTFGMTEASPLITANPLPPLSRKPGSVGVSWGTSIRVLGDDGEPLDPGAPGQLAILGENVFAGYEGEPALNRERFRGGWFLTGDVGYMDADGYLYLTGRTKDLINRGGEKVSPYEVEDALLKHPAVADCAAFSVPHLSLGEEVGVAVVLRPGCVAETDELHRFAAAHLSRFKVPSAFLMLDELPRNAIGKVLRDRLAIALAKQSHRQVPEPPRDRLEASLCRLWSLELDRPVVGIDDDFAALGGDSLAAVRLLSAIERLFGASIPEHAIVSMTTVRKMAALLETLPLDQSALQDDDPLPRLRQALHAGLSPASVTPAVVCREGLGLRPVRWDESSVIQTAAAMESLLDRLSPAELLGLLRGPGTSGASHSRDRSPENDFRKHLLAELERAGEAETGAWHRKEMGPDIDLYTSGESTGPGSRSLLVGFAGRARRLMLPPYRLLLELDPSRWDLLILRPPGRGLYLGGIPGVGRNLQEIGDWLSSWAAERSYPSVSALGTSAGAVPALCVGLFQGWPQIVLVGAQPPSTHGEIGVQFRAAVAMAATRKPPPVVQLLFAPGNLIDAQAATDIASALPFARTVRIVGVDDHNVLHALWRRGRLREVLERVLT